MTAALITIAVRCMFAAAFYAAARTIIRDIRNALPAIRRALENAQ